MINGALGIYKYNEYLSYKQIIYSIYETNCIVLTTAVIELRWLTEKINKLKIQIFLFKLISSIMLTDSIVIAYVKT